MKNKITVGICTLLLLITGVMYLSRVSFVGAQSPYQYRILSPVGGAQVTGNTGFINTSATSASYANLTWTKVGTLSACTVQVDYSNDGSTVAGQLISAQTCTSSGTVTAGASSTPAYVRVSYVITGGSSSNYITFVDYGCNNSSCSNSGGGGAPGGSLYAIQYYLTSGSFGGLNSPTTNCVYNVVFNVTGSAAVAPTAACPGIVPNAQTGTTYTYLYSDRGGYTTASNASAQAYTLPQAGSTGFANNWYNFTCNIGAGTATITPTTSTISYTTGSAYTSGASTLALMTGQCASIKSDNTNYFANVFSAGGGSSVALSAITAATGSNTIANGNNGGQLWNTDLTTNSVDFLKIGETSAGTATGAYLFHVTTASGSTVQPFKVDFNNSHGFYVDAAGNIQDISNNTSTIGGTNAFNAISATTIRTNFIENTSGEGVNANVQITGGLQTSGNNSAAGGLWLQGSDNSSTGSSAAGGFLLERSGMMIAGSPTGPGQVREAGEGYIKGTTVTQWNVQCMTTTANTTADCGASALLANIIGVASNATTPILVIENGSVPINATAAVTIGDTVCLSAVTAGKVTDSGGTGICTTAFQLIGTVVATSGSVIAANGSGTPAAVTLSTTLPLVKLAGSL